ncbi:MAG: ADP-ribosylglycohydrolase family protein [Candidatus Cyclobacteriaceae bacterium M3_2C_046]
MWKNCLFLAGIIAFISCSKQDKQEVKYVTTDTLSFENTDGTNLKLSHTEIYDKIAGMLIGSAIGDAMGAPTEMWSRYNMQVEYGWIDDLDTMVRAPSPEGTWNYNLPAGGTTDDTRWKALLINFISENAISSQLDPVQLAQYLVETYEKQVQTLKDTEGFSPDPFEQEARKMTWLQEWALVARPLAQQDWKSYDHALHHFYGGEMTCAGMLYSPVIGALFPGNPQKAYQQAYNNSIFDLGYARDLTGLVAAMVSEAFSPKVTPESMMNIIRDVDPENYFQSRLVGRSAYRFYREATYIVYQARQLQKEDIKELEIPWPRDFQGDSLQFARMYKAFELLDQKNQEIAFHPAEIFLITLTGLQFGRMNFHDSLVFIINYGRDNDTTGAIAGAILGAYSGLNAIPNQLKDPVISVNQQLDLDLIQLAQKLTDQVLYYQ